MTSAGTVEMHIYLNSRGCFWKAWHCVI